ncbi:MAG: dienelactone hydrolase family protein [Pseudomonadota bacterium]
MKTAMKNLVSLALLGAGLLLSACAAPGEPFRSGTMQGYDFADFTAARPGDLTLEGRLVLPENAAPRAAIILSHGAGGTGSRQDTAAAMFAEAGWAALILDHFGARGVRSVASDQIRVSEQQMASDIFEARDALAARLNMDPSQIGAAGWSKGATAVTLASVERLQAMLAPNAEPLAFAAVFYPFCGFQLDEEELASPLLMLLAGEDDWTPSAPCVRQADAWRAAGQPVSVMVYPDAEHGFDSSAGRFEVGRAITVRDTTARCTLQVDEAGRTVTVDQANSIATPEARGAFLEVCGERGVTFAGDADSGRDARARLLAFADQAIAD